MNERSIFLAALEKEPTDRGAFLDEACRLDAALREQVERTLASICPSRCVRTVPNTCHS
jgi:hypothetical protein